MSTWQAATDSDGNPNIPGDERNVLVFLNGHCSIADDKGRNGGAWGIRIGYFDHDRRTWFAAGARHQPVTHWMDLPDAPTEAARR